MAARDEPGGGASSARRWRERDASAPTCLHKRSAIAMVHHSAQRQKAAWANVDTENFAMSSDGSGESVPQMAAQLVKVGFVRVEVR